MQRDYSSTWLSIKTSMEENRKSAQRLAVDPAVCGRATNGHESAVCKVDLDDFLPAATPRSAGGSDEFMHIERLVNIEVSEPGITA